MNSFKNKLEQEYNKKGLFAFLTLNSTGKTKYYQRLFIKGPELVSADYVLEHPNTNLEKYYIKEIVNILVQEEIKQIIPSLKEITIDINDSEENIILTSKKDYYEKAKVFHCLVEEDLCFPRNKISVDSYFAGLQLFEHTRITSTAEIDFNVDKEPTKEELEHELRRKKVEEIIFESLKRS